MVPACPLAEELIYANRQQQDATSKLTPHAAESLLMELEELRDEPTKLNPTYFALRESQSQLAVASALTSSPTSLKGHECLRHVVFMCHVTARLSVPQRVLVVGVAQSVI